MPGREFRCLVPVCRGLEHLSAGLSLIQELQRRSSRKQSPNQKSIRSERNKPMQHSPPFVSVEIPWSAWKDDTSGRGADFENRGGGGQNQTKAAGAGVESQKLVLYNAGASAPGHSVGEPIVNMICYRRNKCTDDGCMPRAIGRRLTVHFCSVGQA